MKIFIYLILTIELNCVMLKQTAQTLSLGERVNLLKFKISQDINEKLRDYTATASTRDEFEYIEDKNFPVTPINEFDRRKKHGRYRYKEFKNKPIITTPVDTPTRHDEALRSVKKSNKYKVKKPIDIFYRRYMSEEERNTPKKYMHCEDLVTPMLNGMKGNVSQPKVLTANDNIVMRLIQLISLNTTEYTKEEVLSVLYQISNLQLRLFRWDVNAIKLLLNTLSFERRHTFRTVKNGLKYLIYKRWFMDLSNTTNLVTQTRIFRPPCVRSPADTGSTMTTRVERFKKPPGTPKCKRFDLRSECQTRRP